MTRKISIAKPNFGKEEETAVKEVLESGILASGPKTKAFEKEYAEYIGVKHAVAVTNGTIALDVALKALKIGPGDEVITSAFSFVASGNCILLQNAKPVFADIDPKRKSERLLNRNIPIAKPYFTRNICTNKLTPQVL